MRIYVTMSPECDEQHKNDVAEATLADWRCAELLQQLAGVPQRGEYPAPLYLRQALAIRDGGYSLSRVQ